MGMDALATLVEFFFSNSLAWKAPSSAQPSQIISWCPHLDNHGLDNLPRLNGNLHLSPRSCHFNLLQRTLPTCNPNPNFLIQRVDSGPMSLKLPVVRDHHVVYILGHVFVATFLCNCDINELTVRCALEQQTFKRRCLCNPMPRQHRQPADLPWQCKVSSCSTKNSCLTFPW